MTTAIASEVTKRRRAAPAASLRSDFLRDAAARWDDLRRPSWPSPKYRDNPVAFAREVIGVKPWSRQVEILEAVRDHHRVAVASGHKVAKSHTAAILALWFFCSFPDARVVMSSTTSRQVDTILWRELRMQFARSRVILNDAPPFELARSGLKSGDFREIVGFTAREAEAVAGVSGANLLYIVDEASGVPDVIFEAIEGNRAGGARIVMFSNPTKCEGTFFEAFHKKARFWKTLTISSEESPNVTGEWRQLWDHPMGGLAEQKWIDEVRDEWGEDSAWFQVRVKGRFPTNESGKLISLALIQQGQLAWEDARDDGPLHIGVDPAGESGTGDESAFAVRRGQKLLALRTKRGLSDEAHATEVLMLLREFAQPREQAFVAVDVDGVGYDVGLRLAKLEETKAITLIRVKGSMKLARPPFFCVRDAVWSRMREWLKGGGAILTDEKLERELHAPEWLPTANGRQKVTPKTDLRKTLGGSPDRADALALAVWEPSWLKFSDMLEDDDDGAVRTAGERMMDPYGPLDEVGDDRTFDPYGGAG